MNIKIKRTLLIVFVILLVGELAFVGFQTFGTGKEDEQLSVPETTLPVVTTEPTEGPTAVPTEAPTEASTEAPTQAPTEAPTEPQEQRFVLTFTGDCTLGSTASKWNAGSSFVQTVGENYDWPFANLKAYFEADDFTIINLEGPLTDEGSAASKTFAFRGPTAYTQIMTGSSVEAVTLANNHAYDYGKDGYANTITALEGAGIGYVEKDKTALYTTESGLVIGLYACSFDFSSGNISAQIKNLRNQGAEIVICAFHWGNEGEYRPTSSQQKYAKLAIDAGADIVWGNHPHVLQKIEEYGDGIIYYSLGNCSFGGSGSPQDYDAAILQQEVIRDAQGNVSLGELTIIPISVSSAGNYNNYQPTPLEQGSTAYERAMSKLDGSFKGADLIVDYSKLNGNTATTAPTAAPTTGSSSGENPGGDAGTSTGGEAGAPSGDAGAGDAGTGGDAGTSGGDAGASAGGDAGAGSGGDAGTSDAGAAPGADAGSGAGDAGTGEG